ncbi:MAG: hypothetical protein SPH19_06515, partial [Sodaliphilus sp.]|nr:hypothetical protein [Sodaliphilus sp.]
FALIGCDSIRIILYCREWASFFGCLVVWGVGADFRVVAFRVIFLHDEGAKWGVMGAFCASA